ncbi:MAG: transporter substrate-binding domain-containing protein [Opitutales bacterium]|nr:transporter substrate-binding domain-containing protein [Opitutales bacterium]
MRGWMVGLLGIFLGIPLCCGQSGPSSELGTAQEEPASLTIEAKHVNAARAIADALFSYHERHDLSHQKANTEGFKITLDAQKIDAAAKLAERLLPQRVSKRKTPNTEAKKVLRVGVLDHNLPFCEQRGHEFAGFEIDVFLLLAQEGDLQYDFVAISATEAAKKLQDRSIDVVLGSNWCDEDAKDHTSGIVSTDLGAVFLKNQSQGTTTKPSKKLNFTGKCIGVLRDSSAEQFIRSAQIQDAKIVVCDDLKALRQYILQELEGKNLDYALVDHFTAQDWLAQDPRLRYLSLGIRKELAFRILPDSPWRETLNEAIKRVILTPKFRELRDQWSFNL